MYLRYIIAVAALTYLCVEHAAAQDGVVDRVLDGDTIQLDNGRVVHLLGVDAPLFGDVDQCPLTDGMDSWQAPGAQAGLATAHTASWSQGELVKLEWESLDSSLEQADTVSAYVIVLNPDSSRAYELNVALIADGFGLACLRGRHRMVTRYALVQKQARSHHVGLWDAVQDVHFIGAGSNVGCGCEDFSSLRAALQFYEEEGGPDIDPHVLDIDQDGIPCESWFRHDRRARH